MARETALLVAAMLLAIGCDSARPSPASPRQPTTGSRSEPAVESPTVEASDAYRELLSRTAGVALERQLHFGDLVGDRPWEYDVETGEVAFGDDLAWRAEILGTESTGSGTWLWAWANEASDLPESAVRASRRIRARGETEGIAELTQAELPLERAAGHELAMIGVGLGEGRAYYRGPHPGGAVYLLIVDESFPSPPEPQVARWTTLLTQLPTVAELEHRLAYESLFRGRGFEVTASPDQIEAARGDLGFVLTFDERGRMTGLRTR